MEVREKVMDPSNGERLTVQYDPRKKVLEGETSSWRGDDYGMLRWEQKIEYYLNSINPPDQGTSVSPSLQSWAKQWFFRVPAENQAFFLTGVRTSMRMTPWIISSMSGIRLG